MDSDQVDQLTGLIADLQQQLHHLGLEQSRLSARVAELEEGAFTVVKTPRSTTAPSLGIKGSSSTVVVAEPEIPTARVVVAEKIGRWILRCIKGEFRGLSGRETVNLPSRVYLVVKDIGGKIHNPPLVFTSWSSARPKVSSGKHFGDSIFVGLPSKEEARTALVTAQLEVPVALLPEV